MVTTGTRSGRIRLTSPNARGAIWFSGSQILRAELGGRVGALAFYAAMALEAGDFEVALDVTCPDANVDGSCVPLLMEGARRIDEQNRIRDMLGFDVSLARVAEPSNEDRAVAHLFDAPCGVDVALDRCAIGDLEALEVIARLVETGVLVAQEQRAA
jgi:hypothetical protein